MSFLRFAMPAFVALLFATSGLSQPLKSAGAAEEKYQCEPCGYDCDKATYHSAGSCSSCKMPLVLASSIKHTSMSPDLICNYIKEHPGVVLLDVRTAEEFAGKATPNFGSLRNAINIPIQDLAANLQRITHLKDQEILVYCSHSHRSPRASYILTSNGFTRVINMTGGMSAMSKNGCKE